MDPISIKWYGDEELDNQKHLDQTTQESSSSISITTDMLKCIIFVSDATNYRVVSFLKLVTKQIVNSNMKFYVQHKGQYLISCMLCDSK
jgi:hypothetical protein